jgi:predicted O-methyltransferase YrrM
MSRDTWTAVDDYFNGLFSPHDPVLDAALKASDAAGLPAINVSPAQGKLLMLLAQMQGAKTILEIGTLGGYSTIWLARALPDDGKLMTLEYVEKHAEVAQNNIAHAGLAHKVDIRVGRALDHLPYIAAEGHIFDLIFIDADKPSNPDYFAWALKLSRKGSIIILDNVVRDGNVLNANSPDASVIGTRRASELIGSEARVSATTIQTVGSKGYDGFVLMRVVGD